MLQIGDILNPDSKENRLMIASEPTVIDGRVEILIFNITTEEYYAVDLETLIGEINAQNN